MSLINDPDELTFPLQKIPRDLWRDAKLRAAAEIPARSMRIILLDLLTTWTRARPWPEPPPAVKTVALRKPDPPPDRAPIPPEAGIW